MNPCKHNPERLQAWLDGEVDTDVAAIVREEVEHCASCQQTVRQTEWLRQRLRQRLEEGIGEVEPLLALQKIRGRIEAQQRRGAVARLRDQWAELWLFNRRAVLGLGFAVALGALLAPLALFLAARLGTFTPANVVVESLHVQDDAKAVVLHPAQSSTTLIWVEAPQKPTHAPTEP